MLDLPQTTSPLETPRLSLADFISDFDASEGLEPPVPAGAQQRIAQLELRVRELETENRALRECFGVAHDSEVEECDDAFFLSHRA